MKKELKKLMLNKSTVTNLSAAALNSIIGGGSMGTICHAPSRKCVTDLCITVGGNTICICDH